MTKLYSQLVLKCILWGVGNKSYFLLNVVFLWNHHTINIYLRHRQLFNVFFQSKYINKYWKMLSYCFSCLILCWNDENFWGRCFHGGVVSMYYTGFVNGYDNFVGITYWLEELSYMFGYYIIIFWVYIIICKNLETPSGEFHWTTLLKTSGFDRDHLYLIISRLIDSTQSLFFCALVQGEKEGYLSRTATKPHSAYLRRCASLIGLPILPQTVFPECYSFYNRSAANR